MFIEIRTIDDVLPHISFDDGIVVSRRRDHTVIDYVFTTDNTFANPVARECRGLKFDAQGRILARPFHKFFNLGEKERPEEVDWTRPHVVMDKLDGSMVHPCRLGGEMVFMTRMGITAQAKAAFAAMDRPVLALCEAMLAEGRTPLFEFTSPDHRVVVAYAAPRVTLLAIRDTVSGRYLTHAELADRADRFGVPLADSFGQVDEFKSFVARARALEGVEGYVVAFDDGHRLKLKADGYVLRHKALAGVAHEKNLLAWIADDALDDILPLLSEEVGTRVRDYSDQVMAALNGHLDRLESLVARHAELDQKTFALDVAADLEPQLKPVAFAIRGGKDGRAALMDILRRASRSEPRVEDVRRLFGMAWSGNDLVPEEA